MILDDDECIQLDVCENGYCINSEGTFTCVCDNGYVLTGDGRTCTGRRQLPIVSQHINDGLLIDFLSQV